MCEFKCACPRPQASCKKSTGDINPEIDGIPQLLTMEAKDLQALRKSLGNLKTRRKRAIRMEGRQDPETSTNHQSHIWVKCQAECK